MKNADIKVTAHTEKDARVMTLAGRLTPDACELVRAAMKSELEGGTRKLIIVLDGVDSLTSCGVGTLIWINQDCRDNECQLMLVAKNDQVQRTLAAMGLENNFPVHKTIGNALDEEEEQRRVIRRRITEMRRKKSEEEQDD
jgi:anti-anti-sigma factor